MTDIPKRYEPENEEPKWQAFWEDDKLFAFNQDSEKPVYSIDTPPPTVSGKMHLGHAFSFSQQDFIARYKRMRGFNVFQPFGTDDNGLATERLIEKMKGVKATKMDRQEFLKLCLETLNKELRPEYVRDWKRIGMSCDWDISYTTISPESIAISQGYFLDLVKKDRVYRKDSPVMWDPVLQTALSQVELKDKEVSSTFNDIVFTTKEGKKIIIATTRPELLSACVAVFVHPDDKRYENLVGKELTVPLYHFSVPVLTDPRADPDKGTGIVMCCTFGDQTDIEWYKAHQLPLKEAISRDGKMTELAGEFEGMPVKEARKAIIAKLKEMGELEGQKDIVHIVNVGERSDAEIEFIHSPQWYIKYLDLKDKFIELGRDLKWHPEHMRHRYENWVNGLQWDWCISRQRFSGVPFPVWYDKETGEPIFADESQLPVDPLKDLPKGYTRDQVEPETDIMDTWATSSLTPHLAADRFKGTPLYDKIMPMDLRPQAHDIISFWLFNTVVREHLHHDQLPWEHVMISGWALDPKGKKMSKSKGNVIAPQEMIGKYSADALRFWAATSKLGEDVPFQEKDFVTGMKLINKIWNAARFTSMHLKEYDASKPDKLEPIDEWILAELNQVIKIATDDFDNYEYFRVRSGTEQFFFHKFCDNYLEVIKDRLYNPDKYNTSAKLSAQYTLWTVFTDVLKLLAPIMPYITESVYQHFFKRDGGTASIHLAKWPEPEHVHDMQALDHGSLAIDVVSAIRRYKGAAQKSLGAEVDVLTISGTEEVEEQLTPFLADITGSARASSVVFAKVGDDAEVARDGVAVAMTFVEKEGETGQSRQGQE